MMRLQKLLAQAGVASRREAERMIQGGRIKVNGEITTALGTQADPGKDLIEVDGKPISKAEVKVYFMLNKPTGYVTTMKDPQGRPTVKDLISRVKQRIYPVGRLDYDTSGLLLITNDGELANALAHPKKEIEKSYHARLQGVPSEAAINKLQKGIMLDDGMTAPARVTILEAHANRSWVEIIIHEGRNRQVRRMCEAVNHRVLKLKRVRFGPLALGGLALGQLRELTAREVEALKKSIA